MLKDATIHTRLIKLLFTYNENVFSRSALFLSVPWFYKSLLCEKVLVLGIKHLDSKFDNMMLSEILSILTEMLAYQKASF